MSIDPRILDEQYVKGRIWSFVRFRKYLYDVAHIFCEEFDYDKNDIIEVSLSDDGKTLSIHFIDGWIGLASELLWDKNIKETLRKLNDVSYPY